MTGPARPFVYFGEFVYFERQNWDCARALLRVLLSVLFLLPPFFPATALPIFASILDGCAFGYSVTRWIDLIRDNLLALLRDEKGNQGFQITCKPIQAKNTMRNDARCCFINSENKKFPLWDWTLHCLVMFIHRCNPFSFCLSKNSNLIQILIDKIFIRLFLKPQGILKQKNNNIVSAYFGLMKYLWFIILKRSVARDPNFQNQWMAVKQGYA